MNDAKEQFIFNTQQYSEELCKDHREDLLFLSAHTISNLENLVELFFHAEAEPESELIESVILVIKTFQRHIGRGKMKLYQVEK